MSSVVGPLTEEMVKEAQQYLEANKDKPEAVYLFVSRLLYPQFFDSFYATRGISDDELRRRGYSEEYLKHRAEPSEQSLSQTGCEFMAVWQKSEDELRRTNGASSDYLKDKRD